MTKTIPETEQKRELKSMQIDINSQKSSSKEIKKRSGRSKIHEILYAVFWEILHVSYCKITCPLI